SSAATRTSSSTAVSRAGSASSTPGASECLIRANEGRSGRCSGAWSSRGTRSTTSRLRCARQAPRSPSRSWAGCWSRPTRTRSPASGRANVARSYVGEARRRGLGRRRERIGPIVERLAAEHPDAEIALRFRSDLELLVSVMLSAQTTDTNVNRVTEQLFRKYRTPEDYLEVPQEELERDIYATGFFRQKARAIRGTMR